MPEPSRKQLEFFGILIFVCTLTAAAILIIDFQIKGAILEESNRLRKIIEQNTARATIRRTYDYDRYNLDYPADLVPSGDSGLETEGVPASDNGQGRKTGKRASESSPDPGTDQIQG